MNSRPTVGDYNRLLAKVKRLQEENRWLRGHPTLSRGLRGETIITDLLGGTHTQPGSAHDLFVGTNGIRIEVKSSGLNTPVRGSSTRRWVWTKPFGESGNKRYDRLILLGLIDTRFRTHYLDPKAPFVLFDLPFKDVKPLTVVVQSGRYSAIYLTTNPLTARSGTRRLFDEYQITSVDLERRYAL
jgi:hypothetical protein